ncbi:MAG TPA: antibiotic biosynthesis monooxygenase [Novosphingobium sp.]|nr:antibiotic biosynthesis monooxygenase [Novosphingobium sp.]HNN54832.1 antibiotic biosynthesis monooxygenase [Novosphingobium sp.]
MFLVVFRNRKRADLDAAAYSADAARMEALARAQPGFLSFKSYTSEDGEVIAISEWADADSARAWGSQPDHSRVQARGRAEYYQDYTLYTCDNPRTHHYERPPS